MSSPQGQGQGLLSSPPGPGPACAHCCVWYQFSSKRGGNGRAPGTSGTAPALTVRVQRPTQRPPAALGNRTHWKEMALGPEDQQPDHPVPSPPSGAATQLGGRATGRARLPTAAMRRTHWAPQTTLDDQEALTAPKGRGHCPEKRDWRQTAAERLPTATIVSGQFLPGVLSKPSLSSSTSRAVTLGDEIIQKQQIRGCSQVSHFEFN